MPELVVRKGFHERDKGQQELAQDFYWEGAQSLIRDFLFPSTLPASPIWLLVFAIFGGDEGQSQRQSLRVVGFTFF